MRYSGNIGFGTTSLINGTIDCYETTITEKPYKGDVLSYGKRYNFADSINGEVTITNVISVIADKYLIENFALANYITWNNVKYQISSIEVKAPRLLITLGGLYNG